MSIEQVRIPDIGDVSEVEVIELCVAEGDEVEVDDALVVIESDKASMEVPSTLAGKVTSLKVAVGDSCAEGDVIAEIEVAGEDDDSDDADDGGGSKAKGQDKGEADASADEDGGDDADAAGKQDADADDADDADDGGDEDDDTRDSKDDAGSEEIEVKVPDVGDASDVVVVEVMVAVGDDVEADAGLVALESDKATMEIPAPKAGKVVAIEVAEGDKVGEGTLIARLAVKSGGQPSAKRSSGTDAKDGESKGSKSKGKTSAKDEPAPPKDQEKAKDKGKDKDKARESSAAAESRRPTPEPAADAAKVYAGPAVRRLARELGVDLGHVEGSGNKGRIVKEDVHAHVKARMQAAPAAAGGIPAIPEVDFSRFGEIDTQPLSRIMRAGATNLHRSWLNLPHVTQHDEADVTALEELRKSLKADAERAGVKLTPLPFIMKAVQAGLQQFPRFNGSFAADGEHYVFKRYFNIGFAVDTPEGLLVPVVRDVDRKGIFALAEEIAELGGRARELRLKPDEMRGGCISISSLGNIGGTGFTPIVNAPEVAILGVSRLTRKPVWDGDGFVPRDMLPLSLSYDHRAINGAEAGRFMTWLCQALGDIRRLLL
ncbi:MAG: dihydrolipoyllysine-residue acetyltransferase [Gammaproteobacteria bacterium]|nr:MAG: dihydrolipoyllysine-residue acetyltransferase [Gammaproteobacteria bacterium]